MLIRPQEIKEVMEQLMVLEEMLGNHRHLATVQSAISILEAALDDPRVQDGLLHE